MGNHSSPKTTPVSSWSKGKKLGGVELKQAAKNGGKLEKDGVLGTGGKGKDKNLKTNPQRKKPSRGPNRGEPPLDSKGGVVFVTWKPLG